VPPTHIHMCGMSHFCGVTRPCAWHAAFICVTWLIVVCDCRTQIMRVTGLVSMFDFSLSYVWWLMSVACLIQTCVRCFVSLSRNFSLFMTQVYNINHSCVWHAAFMCVTHCIHTCDMTRCLRVQHDAFARAAWPNFVRGRPRSNTCHTCHCLFEWVISSNFHDFNPWYTSIIRMHHTSWLISIWLLHVACITAHRIVTVECLDWKLCLLESFLDLRLCNLWSVWHDWDHILGSCYIFEK